MTTRVQDQRARYKKLGLRQINVWIPVAEYTRIMAECTRARNAHLGVHVEELHAMADEQREVRVDIRVRAQTEYRADRISLCKSGLIGYMSTRCAVSAQHKLPTLDELQKSVTGSVFGDVMVKAALGELLAAGKIIQYGPYYSDREIEYL